jgi:hypothetical protein
MTSDPESLKNRELDALVSALRSDLPSERDSNRLRARLSALGLAASEALVTSSAAASTSLAQGAALGSAGAGAVAAQVGGVSWALKASVVAVVSATAVVGPAWYMHERATSAAPAASSSTMSASVNAQSKAAGAQKARASQASALAAANDGEPRAGEARERTVTTLAPRSAPLAAGTPQTGGASSPTREANNAPGEARAQVGASSTAGFGENGDTAQAQPAARTAEPTTLREETALIDRALSALRAKDMQRATALLAEHERRFPNGLLSQERERARRKLAELLQPEGAR